MQQTGTKGIQDNAWMGEKDDWLGTIQKIKVWLCWQMVYAQTRICLRKWDTWNYLGLWDTKRLSNTGQKTRPCVN